MKDWKGAAIYLLTSPERLLRALAAALGGVVFVLADLLVPRALQRTTIYYLLFGGGMRYAVEGLAGMRPKDLGTDTLPSLPERYQRRKLAGTAIEAAGLLTVGFSPLWVFAIAGDAVAGSKVFLQRLERHLKQQGAIREDADVNDLTDLLGALQDTARAMTNVLDTPPLSRSELEQISTRLRRSYAEVFAGTRNLAGRLDGLWERMQGLTGAGNISIGRLETQMAGGVLARVKQGRAALTAVSATSNELIGEEILEGYRHTLDEAAKGGWRRYLTSAYRPFWEAAGYQFSLGAFTLIGDWLTAEQSEGDGP